MKPYIFISFLSLSLAVILGAFGAHAWKTQIQGHEATYHLACHYHIWVSIVLLILGILFHLQMLKTMKPFFGLLLGMSLFCGSLYGLSFSDHLTSDIKSILGPITPIGGVLIILSLLWLAFVFFKK